LPDLWEAPGGRKIMAENRRKGMTVISMFASPDDKKEIKKILGKPIKEESDLAQLGDIIGSINARGDFDTR